MQSIESSKKRQFAPSTGMEDLLAIAPINTFTQVHAGRVNGCCRAAVPSDSGRLRFRSHPVIGDKIPPPDLLQW